MSPDLLVAGNLAEDVIFGESYYGGSAGNIALNASVFGLSTGIISRYGRDDFSKKYLEYLERRNVRTDLLQPGLDSIAQCIVTSSANHSSSKRWIDNGASEALRTLNPLEHQRDVIARSRFLHLSTTPGSLALILSGIERPAGFLGYEPGPRIGDDDTYFSEEVFRRSDILFVNEEELDILQKSIGFNALRRMMQEDQAVVATKGKNGTELITQYDSHFYRAESISESDILDSNGAGDAFKSGFYVGLAETGRIDVGVQYGNALGAYIVQKKGALLHPEEEKNIERFNT